MPWHVIDIQYMYEGAPWLGSRSLPLSLVKGALLRPPTLSANKEGSKMTWQFHRQSHTKWKWCIHVQALAGPKGTSKSHEDVAQKPVFSAPVTMSSALNHAAVASWGVSYAQLADKEKTGAWLTDGSARCVGTTQKWTAAALPPQLGQP